MLEDILFYGDPHGGFEPLFDAVARRRPAAVILLGDMGAEESLDRVIAPVIEATCGQVWWIPGNHDADRPDLYHNVFSSKLADRNLHGRVAEVAGVRVGGLGGVFRGKVWYPRLPGAEARYWSRQEYLASVKPQARWHGGLPLGQRATIFPEDMEALAAQRCDVLVSHEGPSVAEHGFAAVESLAAAMGAKALVHGHLHVDYEARAANGVLCVGCGLQQPKWGSDFAAALEPAASPAPR